jgi:hypothetical protein
MSKRKDLVDAEVVEGPSTELLPTQSGRTAARDRFIRFDGPLPPDEEIIEAPQELDPRVEALAIAMREVYIRRLSVRSRPSIPLHFVELNSEERASWFAVAEFVING